jgi:DNA-binding response OmpR family regulator
VLRRATADVEDAPSVLQSGALRLDADRHEATLGEAVLTLSPKEFALLEYLMRHSGRARSRDDILQAVWGTDDYLDERTVDVHVRWLRMKIEAEPSQPEMLLTVRGIGYKFTDAP